MLHREYTIKVIAIQILRNESSLLSFITEIVNFACKTK